MKKRSLTLVAAGLAGMLALSGCSAIGAEVVGNGNDDKKKMNLAVFNGWDEGIAVSELWKAILEDEGYDVKMHNADVAPVLSGLSTGDYDLTMDIWLPETHASFMEEYGEDITDLGAWNNESKLTIAVNEDAPINSIDELAENADLFGNRIVGIEPGAGLTAATEDRVIPEYGLEDMEFLTSSTAGMLAELKAATESGENIAVTLWEPHWANSEFPVKNLEDPKGALGATESLHAYGKSEFAKDFPQAAGWLSDFEMDLDRLYSLEDAMFVNYDGYEYGPIVREWMEQNQDYVDSLTP